MKKTAICCTVLLFCCLQLAAQGDIQGFGGNVDERGSTRILYFSKSSNSPAGEFAINFGRPAWKPEFAGQLDQMKGGYWRFGNNFWTVLDTNVPLSVGGVSVPVGYYYLMVARSQDGAQWSLALVDPDSARNLRMDPYQVPTDGKELKVLYSAPLQFSQREEQTDKLAITLHGAGGADPSDVTLTIEWAKFALTAPIKADLSRK